MTIGLALRTLDSLRRFRPGKTHKAIAYGDLEDGRLLALCIGGDTQARQAFVTRYERYIRSIVGRTVRKYTNDVDSTVLDDLSQDVLMGLFEKDCRRLKMFESSKWLSA